jgi:hypothetical protein
MNNTITYLCIYNINKFNCTKFNDFHEANNYYLKNNNNNTLQYSTIIFICKYIPLFLHKYFIKNKLSNIFLNNIHLQ